ncbi:hypothetical protein ABHI18_010657 [Aspergillus niger]
MERQVALCAATAVAIWVLQIAYKLLRSPLRHIPGPLYTRVTRLPLKFSIVTGRRIYFIHDLHQKYGPVVRIAPDEVSVSSLPEFKEIHRVGSAFLKTPWYQKFAWDRNPGLFTMRDPKEHAARRKLFARVFSKSDLRRTWEPVVKDKVQLAVSQIRGELLRDGISDILKWWTFLATDVSGHLMFGESFDMLQYGKKNEYINVLESTMMGSGINVELPIVGLLGRYVPLASCQAMFRPSDYLTEYGRRAVSNSRTNSNSTRNIFTGMLNESEKASSMLSEEDVVIEAGNLIVAGSDTTAVTLTYLVWAVLSQPSLQHDLEEEVSALDPNYDEAALEELPLLNAVITETLRLYGAAPGSLPRSVPNGGATFCGYHVPQGATELYPDPETFDATRWLGGHGNGSDVAKQALSPFGYGTRICLGVHLAWMELRLAATEFFPSTPETPGPRILDAKAMSDPQSAHHGPSTKGPSSAGTASTLHGNEWMQKLARLCGPSATLRNVGTPMAEIESMFDSVFPRNPVETLRDFQSAQPVNAVQLYGSNEDILDAYYIFIHPYYPILPPPDRLPVIHNPAGVDHPDGFKPASPLALAISAMVALVPHKDVKNPARPEHVKIRREVALRFAEAAYAAIAKDYQPLRAPGGFEGSLRDSIGRPPFHSKLPVCLEGVIALSILCFYEYGQQGNLDNTARLANEALEMAFMLGLHESLEENEYALARRRSWWFVYMAASHMATVTGTPAPFDVYDPSFVTPYPKGWRLRVEAQQALYEAGIFAVELDETIRRREDASWIQKRMTELDTQITSLLFECRDTLSASQGPQPNCVESVASSALRSYAEIKLHSARIKLHRYCAFQDVPMFSEQPGLHPISPTNGNIGSSASCVRTLPQRPASIQEFGIQFPFSAHTSSVICVHAAINLVTLLDSLPFPNPTNDVSPTNLPYIFQNYEVPRAMPTLISCAMQAGYTMLTLSCKARPFVTKVPELEAGDFPLAGLRNELEQSLRVVAKFLANHAIAFEAIQGMRDEMMEAIEREFGQV